MTLEQFIDNKWMKLLTRGAMIAVAAGSGYIGVRLAMYESRILGVETSVSDVSETQLQRALVNDQFQASVTTELDRLNAKASALQLDMATVRGILTEMQRRDVAARFVIE